LRHSPPAEDSVVAVWPLSSSDVAGAACSAAVASSITPVAHARAVRWSWTVMESRLVESDRADLQQKSSPF
jgi:hypothetical protein